MNKSEQLCIDGICELFQAGMPACNLIRAQANMAFSWHA